jgi:hypothetical protein
VLEAEEYAQGHLDWYSFDRVPGTLGGPVDPGEQVAVSSFLPTPVTFQGMPIPAGGRLKIARRISEV